MTGGSRHVSYSNLTWPYLIITRVLGALNCEKFAAEGSNVVVNYVSSENRAHEIVGKYKRCFGVKSTEGVSEKKCGPEYSCSHWY